MLAFAAAALLLAIAPGPATAVLLRQTIRHGRRRGIVTVAGIEAGVFFWAVTATFGLTALLAASQVAYTVLQVAGAVVLLSLGAQAIIRSRHAHPDPVGDPSPAAPVAIGHGPGFRAGLLTNLANPKAGVFAVSFLPQFIGPHSPVLATGLLLAAVWVVCDGSWYLGLVATVHAARRWFVRETVRRRLERILRCRPDWIRYSISPRGALATPFGRHRKTG